MLSALLAAVRILLPSNILLFIGPNVTKGFKIDHNIFEIRCRKFEVSGVPRRIVTKIRNTLFHGVLGRSRKARFVRVIVVRHGLFAGGFTTTLRRLGFAISRFTIVGVIFHRFTRVFTTSSGGGFVTLFRIGGTRRLLAVRAVFVTLFIVTGAVAGAVFFTLFTLFTLGIVLMLIEIDVREVGVRFRFFEFFEFFRIFRLPEFVKFFSEFRNLIKGFGLSHTSHILLFISREGNRYKTKESNLKVKIETVDQREF